MPSILPTSKETKESDLTQGTVGGKSDLDMPDEPDTGTLEHPYFLLAGAQSQIGGSNFMLFGPKFEPWQGIDGSMDPDVQTAAETMDPDNLKRPRNTFVTHSSYNSQIGAYAQVFMFQRANGSAEAIKSPIRGFHAWNDTEKVNALTAVHSLQTIIQAFMPVKDHNSDNDKKTIDSLHASLSSYFEFLNYLVESKLLERTGSLQARAICLVVLAGVAISLGVVQLLTLALTAGMATESSNSSVVGRVINIFAFCGVSFDALGAVFALLTFRSIFVTISKIDKIVLEKQNLTTQIHFTLDTFREAAASSLQEPGYPQPKVLAPDLEISPKNLVSLFAGFQQYSAKQHREARGVMHLIDDHLPVQEDFIALAIIIAGLLFFFISLFSLIINSQPLSVWVSTTVVVAVTFIFLRIHFSHQQPGLRRVMKRAHATIVEYLPLRIQATRGSEAEDNAEELVV